MDTCHFEIKSENSPLSISFFLSFMFWVGNFLYDTSRVPVFYCETMVVDGFTSYLLSWALAVKATHPHMCRFWYHVMYCFSRILKIDARLCGLFGVTFCVTNLCICSLQGCIQRGFIMDYLVFLILSPHSSYAINFVVDLIRFIWFKEAWMTCLPNLLLPLTQGVK